MVRRTVNNRSAQARVGGHVGEARMKGQARGLSARLRHDSARRHATRLLGPGHAGSPGSRSEDAKEFTASHTAQHRSSRKKLVDVRGFEPLTLALQTRCSPS